MKTLLKRLVFVGAALIPSMGLALVTISEEGHWPAAWPDELEPLRKQARTVNVATRIQQQIHEIRFKDEAEFSQIWPVILKLKTADAPVTLHWIDDPPTKVWGPVLTSGLPMVRIYTPNYGSISGAGDDEKPLVAGPPWPPLLLQENGALPEFVRTNEANGKLEWIPAELEKVPDARPDPLGHLHGARNPIQPNEKGFKGFLYRARVDLDLVVDGNVINLTKIYFPHGTRVHSDRHPMPELTGVQLGALAAEAMDAYRNSPKDHQPGNRIPETAWGPTMRSLKPLRVVNDRVNIKIVLSEDKELEAGFYVNQPISSFLPFGDHFLEYVPLTKIGGVELGNVARYKMARAAPVDQADD